MAQLAIRGHATRGREVIELLEMLGGKNKASLQGTDTDLVYCIHSEDYIDTLYAASDKHYKVFTLEEFLEKFPYKVGDKVIDIKTDRIAEIYGAHWSVSNNCTYYDLKRPDNTGFVRSYKFLQPFKEETMEEKADMSVAPILQSEDYSGRRFGYKIPKGYEFDCIKENKIIIKPIKPQYPKTYEECCKVLSLGEDGRLYTKGYKSNLIQDFQKLLICRDAYWKMAGDWKPDWEKSEQPKFGLYTLKKEIQLINLSVPKNLILVFPTEEIRDIFYNNFKELIELVKELL